MRLVLRPTLLLLCLAASYASASAQTATVVGTSPARVEVNLDKLNPSDTSKGGLFVVRAGKLKQVTSQIIPDGVDAASSHRRFHFEFPATPPNAYDPDKTYQVVLFTPVTDAENNPSVVAITLTVTKRVELSMLRSDLRCESGILVLATGKVRPDETNWPAVYNWLSGLSSTPDQFATVRLRVIGEDEATERAYQLKSFNTETPQALAQRTNEMFLCLKTEDRLPVGAFAAKVEFHGANRPADFGPKVEAKELKGRYITSAISSDLKDPAERELEQNLDLGVTFSSSVANKETPATATTPATTIRKRTNRGVLDVRFAPVLNLFDPVIVSNKWLPFWTPIFLNANVATGKIEEDTLSLNRVLIGTDFEARRNVRRTTVEDNPATPVDETRYDYPLTHRVIFGLTNASDRDFKQKEFTGKVEYKPIIWKLNNPINLNYKVRNGEKREGTLGFVFLPMVGFEIGRTYSRRNPAPAIKPSETVRRFYMGVEMNVDVTRHLTFTVNDTFYVRGETPDDRAKNYFKGGVEAPLGAVFNRAVHSLFFSFELGDLPPFATPSVNALKVGYRIQFSYCGKCR
jgi:hypothetical protein